MFELDSLFRQSNCFIVTQNLSSAVFTPYVDYFHWNLSYIVSRINAY